MDYSYLYNGETVDTGYGFISNKNRECVSDRELFELEEDDDS